MSIPSDIDSLHDFAVNLARAGGALAAQWNGSRDPTLKSDNSPVTEADLAVQAHLLTAIAESRPQDAVLVEETVADPHRHKPRGAGYCWVIDPIDGTRNFALGSRTYATAVALLLDGMPIVGAIYDARSTQVYHAARGRGAWLDGRRLHIRLSALDDHTIVAISSFRRKRVPDGIRRIMDFVMFRNLGSLALHTAEVAAGTIHALYSHEAKAWDIAAGAVLIEQAGGLMLKPDSQPRWPLDVAAYNGHDMPLMAGSRELCDALRGCMT